MPQSTPEPIGLASNGTRWNQKHRLPGWDRITFRSATMLALLSTPLYLLGYHNGQSRILGMLVAATLAIIWVQGVGWFYLPQPHRAELKALWRSSSFLAVTSVFVSVIGCTVGLRWYVGVFLPELSAHTFFWNLNAAALKPTSHLVFFGSLYSGVQLGQVLRAQYRRIRDDEDPDAATIAWAHGHLLSKHWMYLITALIGMAGLWPPLTLVSAYLVTRRHLTIQTQTINGELGRNERA